MHNKKLYLVFVIVTVVVAVAAFIGGRLINGGIGGLGFFQAGGPFSTSITLERAPELPGTEPTVNGTFVERKANTIIVQAFETHMGSGGGVVVSSAVDASNAPKVEVVITNKTIIYRDATEFNGHPSGGETTLQQKLEEGTLDDLNTQAMVMVWGRKNGDRIIADVLVYIYPLMFKRP